MGRKAIIEQNALIELIDRFFIEECEGGRKRFKIPECAAYIQANGYPGFSARLLRRNEAAREHIDMLCADKKAEAISTIVTYKTLDVTAFLAANKSYPALRKALTELDAYYSSIASYASSLIDESKKALFKCEKLESEMIDHKLHEEQLSDEVARLKSELSAAKKEVSAYRSMAKEYIYPEIALRLLEKRGLSKVNEGNLNEDSVESKLVTANTIITPEEITKPKPSKKKAPALLSGSGVISGMFDDFN